MNWFLVLLFWNPAIQAFDVSDGWYPMPYATETICDMKLDYVKMYLPSYTADIEHEISCVQAPSMKAAIATAKEIANE